MAEQTVTIFDRSLVPGSPAAGVVGTAMTDATGHYEFTTAPLNSNGQFYATTGGAQSGRKGVKVSPRVSLGGPADGSQLFTGGGPAYRAHLSRLGESNKVVFSGVVSPALAASVATPMALLARTRLQRHFVPVASVTSGPDGSYSFPAQAPQQSTFYKVTGGGQASSRLFEGVRYGLTATPGASGANVGEAVPFSGTVTPARAEHPVYLQVQNGSGVGFHIVEQAEVSSAGHLLLRARLLRGGHAQAPCEDPRRPRKPGRGEPPVQPGSEARAGGHADT